MRHSDVIGSRWQKKKKLNVTVKLLCFMKCWEPSSSTEGFSPVSVYNHVIHHTPIESMSSSCRSVTVSFNMSGKFIYLRLTGLWFPRRIKKGKPFFFLYFLLCVWNSNWVFHAGPRLVGSLVSAFSCPFTSSFSVKTPVALPILFYHSFFLKRENKIKICLTMYGPAGKEEGETIQWVHQE